MGNERVLLILIGKTEGEKLLQKYTGKFYCEKMLNNMRVKTWGGSSCSEQGRFASSCEQANELSGFIKVVDVIYQLSNYQFLTEILRTFFVNLQKNNRHKKLQNFKLSTCLKFLIIYMSKILGYISYG
jgi:hypothetical protein